jgi:hypothetical protein
MVCSLRYLIGTDEPYGTSVPAKGAVHSIRSGHCSSLNHIVGAPLRVADDVGHQDRGEAVLSKMRGERRGTARD